MPLILAIEPDHRQASQLRAMARGRLGADLVHADSAEPALIALAGRVPDLILMPALLSPADEAAIGDYLRVLDAASSHVQTLIIPVLAANRPRSRRRGVLASLKRQQDSVPEGCDPKEFAEQCATYLERAAAERERRAEAVANAAVDALVEPVVESAVDPVLELAVAPVVESAVDPVLELAVEPVLEWGVEPVLESHTEPAAEALIEYFGELQAEPVRKALVVEPLIVEPPVVESLAVEPLVVESLEEPIEADLEAALQSLEVVAVETPLECAAEPAVDEDQVFEIAPPARELEFIELDLSTLVEELAGPNLAIPTEVPVSAAAIENAVTAPVTVAARETAPPAVTAVEPELTPPAESAELAPAVEPVAVVEEPVAPLHVAVKWTAVYSPPGRSWPSIEGVAVEADSPASHPSSSRASVQTMTTRKPDPKAVQDEWGFFDPTQCGFTALLSKLDEITTEEAPLKQRA